MIRFGDLVPWPRRIGPVERDRRADQLRCPHCSSVGAAEFDKILHKWSCNICGRLWTDRAWPRRPRL